MSYLRLAFGLGLSIVAGYLLADILLWQIRSPIRLKFWLGIGIGLGLSSLVYFAWRLFFLPAGWIYFLVELMLTAGLGFAWILLRQRSKQTELDATLASQVQLPASSAWLLNLSLVFATLAAGFTYIFGTLIFPHGGWDACVTPFHVRLAMFDTDLSAWGLGCLGNLESCRPLSLHRRQ